MVPAIYDGRGFAPIDDLIPDVSDLPTRVSPYRPDCRYLRRRPKVVAVVREATGTPMMESGLAAEPAEAVKCWGSYPPEMNHYCRKISIASSSRVIPRDCLLERDSGFFVGWHSLLCGQAAGAVLVGVAFYFGDDPRFLWR